MLPSPSTLLDREARLLVARVRDWSAARWGAAAPPFATRADAAHHLAARLADFAHVVEGGASPPPLPRLGSDLVLPDQLAVTALDLRRALLTAAGGPEGPAGRRVAAAALAELLLHRRDLDGAGPLPDSTAAVLAALAPGSPASPNSPALAPRGPARPGAGGDAERMLALAAACCPAYARRG